MITADEFEYNDIVYKNTERNIKEKGAMVSFVVRFSHRDKEQTGTSSWGGDIVNIHRGIEQM